MVERNDTWFLTEHFAAVFGYSKRIIIETNGAGFMSEFAFGWMTFVSPIHISYNQTMAIASPFFLSRRKHKYMHEIRKEKENDSIFNSQR